MSAGVWVPGQRGGRPYFDALTCGRAIDPGYSAYACTNGRAHGQAYMHWHWQPAALGCHLPVLSRQLLQAALGGKRLLLVGDSLVRNMYVPLACTLAEAFGLEAVKLMANNTAVHSTDTHNAASLAGGEGRAGESFAGHANGAIPAAAGAGGGWRSRGRRRLHAAGSGSLSPAPGSSDEDGTNGTGGAENVIQWRAWQARQDASGLQRLIHVPSQGIVVEYSPSSFLALPEGRMEQVDPRWAQLLVPGPWQHPVDVLVIRTGHWLNRSRLRFHLPGNGTTGDQPPVPFSSNQPPVPLSSNHSNHSNTPLPSARRALVPTVQLADHQEAFSAIVSAVRTALDKLGFRGRVFWLGYPPKHYGCEHAHSPGHPSDELVRQADSIITDEVERAAVERAGWELLDIRHLSQLRPDAHVGSSGVAHVGSGVARVGSGDAQVGFGDAHIGSGVAHVGSGDAQVGSGDAHVGSGGMPMVNSTARPSSLSHLNMSHLNVSSNGSATGAGPAPRRAKVDCLHFCLGGVTNAWLELLMMHLVAAGQQ